MKNHPTEILVVLRKVNEIFQLTEADIVKSLKWSEKLLIRVIAR